MNKKEAIRILAILRSAYPNVRIDNAEATAKAWEISLGQFSAESVMKASMLHLQTSKFFPTPADIREKIVRAEIVYSSSEVEQDELESTIQKKLPSGQDEEAWQKVREIMIFLYGEDSEFAN